MDDENGTRVNINHKSSHTAAPRSHRVSTQPTASGRPTEADLAAAFSEDVSEPTESRRVSKDGKKAKKPLTKERKIGIGVLVVGIIALIAGIGYLVYSIINTPNASDADFLVEVKTWQREDAPSVIWEFTEVGKGQLTTNEGENTYDFTWAFDDGKLKIDTDWLYTLNDEYEFSIDQHDKKLTLKDGENGELVFVPSEQSLDDLTPVGGGSGTVTEPADETE